MGRRTKIALGILYNLTVKLGWRLTRREVLTMDAVLPKEHTTDWRTSFFAFLRPVHLDLAFAGRAMQAALFRPAAGGRGARQLRILRVWRGCDRFWFSPEKFRPGDTATLYFTSRVRLGEAKVFCSALKKPALSRGGVAGCWVLGAGGGVGCRPKSWDAGQKSHCTWTKVRRKLTGFEIRTQLRPWRHGDSSHHH